MGENPAREGLIDTPARVARAYTEICGGLETDPCRHLDVTFAASYHGPICVSGIGFYSICEHHLLPFFGTVDICYIPGDSGRVCGLSKLARVVEGFARRPQLQERLTSQIADALEKTLAPEGVLVRAQAEHMCMSMRGVKKPGSRTFTMATRGVLDTDPARLQACLTMLQQRSV